jgi:hypothetical protein
MSWKVCVVEGESHKYFKAFAIIGWWGERVGELKMLMTWLHFLSRLFTSRILECM